MLSTVQSTPSSTMGFHQLLARKPKITFKRRHPLQKESIDHDDNVSTDASTSSSVSGSSRYRPTSPCHEIENFDTNTSRKVRFASAPHKQRLPANAYFYTDEVNHLWYSKQERQECKDLVAKDAEEAARKQSDFVVGLEAAYRNAFFLASTMDDDQIHALLNDPTALSKHGMSLNTAISEMREVSCRGLEEMLSEFYKSGKEEFVQEARSMVVSTAGYTGTSDLPEEIAVEYKCLSRTALLVARLLAEADAVNVFGKDFSTSRYHAHAQDHRRRRMTI